MGYCLINEHKLGIAKEFNSTHDYAESILKIVNLSKEEYDVLGKNSRKTALNFDYFKLTNDLIALIKQTDNL